MCETLSVQNRIVVKSSKDRAPAMIFGQDTQDGCLQQDSFLHTRINLNVTFRWTGDTRLDTLAILAALERRWFPDTLCISPIHQERFACKIHHGVKYVWKL